MEGFCRAGHNFSVRANILCMHSCSNVTQWYFEKFRSVMTLLYTYVYGLNFFPVADW